MKKASALQALLGTCFALCIFLACSRSPSPTPPSLPSFAQQFLIAEDRGAFFASHGLSDPPPSIASGQHCLMAHASDSIAVFVVQMPSKQGAVVAFQEWTRVSDSFAELRSFPKTIGKRAVGFSTTGRAWVVFYHGYNVYGVVAAGPGSALSLARKWWKEMG